MKATSVTERVFSSHEFKAPVYFLRDSSQKSANFGNGSSPVFVFDRLSAFPEAAELVRTAVKKGMLRSEYGFLNGVWLRLSDGDAERAGVEVVEIAYRRTTPWTAVPMAKIGFRGRTYSNAGFVSPAALHEKPDDSAVSVSGELNACRRFIESFAAKFAVSKFASGINSPFATLVASESGTPVGGVSCYGPDRFDVGKVSFRMETTSRNRPTASFTVSIDVPEATKDFLPSGVAECLRKAVESSAGFRSEFPWATANFGRWKGTPYAPEPKGVKRRDDEIRIENIPF